jgi:hypothetical protein
VGIIAYAGPETKLSLNQKKPPFKTSRLDKRLNKYTPAHLLVRECRVWCVHTDACVCLVFHVYRYVLILFVINMLINLGMGIGGGLFDYYYAEDSPYLTVRATSPHCVANAGQQLTLAGAQALTN